MVTRLDEYAERYKCLRIEREDGILQMTLHTDGGEFQWGRPPHEELSRAFWDIGSDPETRVVIFTGTGATFTAPAPTIPDALWPEPPTPSEWDVVTREAKRMLMGLLDIEVPIIAAINGPVYRHGELPLLSDIVLCTDDATFEDSAHFAIGNLVPGDGVNLIFPLLMGINRARYFHLTGQRIGAAEAKEMGLVNEVLARDELMPRARELAESLAAKPPVLVRYSRVILTEMLRRLVNEYLGYGLILEGVATMERPDR